MLGRHRVQAARRGGKCCQYLSFCCCRRRQHILITFVGMTLLIVSYGVNTVQMSAEPSRNKVVSSVNNSGIHDDVDGHGSSRAGMIMNGSNEGSAYLLQQHIALPSPEGQGDKHHDDVNDGHGAGDTDDGGRQSAMAERLINLRKSRLLGLFGLLGTNFSLAYNLTVGGSNTAANITVAAAPAPVYYYAPAPYAYDYYNPYAYNPYAYNPYAYNPYAYNPYASYYG